MNITSGKQQSPIRGLVYGPEGIGKTTFAAAWPKPLFIDIEDGSSRYEVARTPRPTSWNMLSSIIAELTTNSHGYQTVVIDTADWAAQLCAQHIISKAASGKIRSIEDFGYGKGWVMVAEEFKRLLDAVAGMQQRQGVHVLFVAHAIMRKFEQPDEMGAYDRYELKTEKKTCALLKEWADLVLFANYETFVVEDGGKRKGQGGARVMHSQHHPCWDAKNRFGLAAKLPFDFSAIASIFGPMQKAPETSPAPRSVPGPVESQTPSATQATTPNPAASVTATDPEALAAPVATGKPAYIPAALWDLMTLSGVTEDEIRAAVVSRGYYPAGTPFAKYEKAFVEKTLVGSFEKVKAVIEKLKQEGMVAK